MTLPLSCTIIARNEEDRISRAIASVKNLVDEIIVVDSGSTDNTPALAMALGARVIHNDWVGYGPQKRFAEDQAKNDWILNLDADEWLTDDLREEIRGLFVAGAPSASSYKMRVTIVYPKAERPAPFADSTICLRLYDRRRARFDASLVHDNVPEQADTVLLKGAVWHRSFRRLADVVRKEIAYFELQQKEKRKPRWELLLRLPFEMPFQFLRFYFLMRHCFGGMYGFALSVAIAFGRFLRLAILLGW